MTGKDDALCAEQQGELSVSRRAFLSHSAAAAGAVAAGSFLTLAPVTGNAAVIPGPASEKNLAKRRSKDAYDVRVDAARFQRAQPLPDHPDNGDEAIYAAKIGSFTKALPHNDLGEVELDAFNQLRQALISGSNNDFEAIPLGRYPQVGQSPGHLRLFSGRRRFPRPGDARRPGLRQ